MSLSSGWGRTKPPGGCRLDWRHPLARGLLHSWPLAERGGSRTADLAGNTALVLAANAGWTASGGGGGLAVVSDDDTTIAEAERADAGALTEATFWVAGVVSALTFYDGFLVHRGSAGAVHGMTTDSGAIHLGYNWNDDSAAYGWSGGPVIPLDTPLSLAAVVSASAVRVYAGRATDANATAHASATLNTTWRLANDPLGRTPGMAVEAAGLWGRALPPAEIEALFAAPYDVVWKPRYWYVGAQAAAAAASLVPPPPAWRFAHLLVR
jgi:hypothetical protein